MKVVMSQGLDTFSWFKIKVNPFLWPLRRGQTYQGDYICALMKVFQTTEAIYSECHKAFMKCLQESELLTQNQR